MFIRRKKAFRQLFQFIRAIEADHDDLVSVHELNLLVLKQVLQAEQAILRHRETQRALNKQLKIGRGSKQESAAVRESQKRVARYITAYQDQIFIWKSFGDALTYVYLDKFSIKHAFFEIDRLDIKENAGMMRGKDGLASEMALMLDAIAHGVPAVLCDCTNVLRYGDVCLLGGSDPFLIEVKSNPKINQRGKRQIARLQKLHSFLETDSAIDFRGNRGITKRISLSEVEGNNIEALNNCIANAKHNGRCEVEPEPGVTYLAIYGKPNLDAIPSAQKGKTLTMFMLNEDKNSHAWAPYTPFILSIRDLDHLLDFIEGRLILIVLIDGQVLCDMMGNEEWAVRFRPGQNYAIQCLHRATKAYVGVSSQFFARTAYEFTSLKWLAETHQPSLQRLEEFAGNPEGPFDPNVHARLLIEMFGPDDEWTR